MKHISRSEGTSAARDSDDSQTSRDIPAARLSPRASQDRTGIDGPLAGIAEGRRSPRAGGCVSAFTILPSRVTPSRGLTFAELRVDEEARAEALADRLVSLRPQPKNDEEAWAELRAIQASDPSITKSLLAEAMSLLMTHAQEDRICEQDARLWGNALADRYEDATVLSGLSEQAQSPSRAMRDLLDLASAALSGPSKRRGR